MATIVWTAAEEPPVTPELEPVDRHEARRLRSAGLTLREIGAHFGVSRQRIQQVLGRTGKGVPVHSVVIAFYTCEYCGVMFKRPRHAGPRQFCSYACRGKSQVIYDINAVAELRKAGLSQAAIARQLGISPMTVSRAVRQYEQP